jgi:hypothetical protein
MPRSIKVGALSELFFYSMILNDARKGGYGFMTSLRGRGRLSRRPTFGWHPRIHGRVLGEALHSLLSRNAFNTLTTTAASWGWTIDYGFHDPGGYVDQAAASDNATRPCSKSMEYPSSA